MDRHLWLVFIFFLVWDFFEFLLSELLAYLDVVLLAIMRYICLSQFLLISYHIKAGFILWPSFFCMTYWHLRRFVLVQVGQLDHGKFCLFQ